jgi:hypothetical protein
VGTGVLVGVLCTPNTLQPLRRTVVIIKMENNFVLRFIIHLIQI